MNSTSIAPGPTAAIARGSLCCWGLVLLFALENCLLDIYTRALRGRFSQQCFVEEVLLVKTAFKLPLLCPTAIVCV